MLGGGRGACRMGLEGAETESKCRAALPSSGRSLQLREVVSAVTHRTVDQ